MVLEGIHNIKVNAPGSRRRARARSRLRVAPRACLSFIRELVRGVVSTGGGLKISHGLVHSLGSGAKDIERDICVQPELGKGVPVSKLKEQVCDSLIIAKWEESLKSWHNCLGTNQIISTVNTAQNATSSHLKKCFIISSSKLLSRRYIMPEFPDSVTPKCRHPSHAGNRPVSTLARTKDRRRY